MIEKRTSARSRTCFGGTIAFNRRRSTMDCQVRNLSPIGARIAFTNAAAVPDQFELTIARKDRAFKARMVWRGINEAGVAFLSDCEQAVPSTLDWARRLRASEAEKVALRRRIEQLTDGSV